MRDLHRYFIPLWHFGVESLKHGRIPFWNPYIYSGSPFAAELPACTFYPPMLLFFVTGVVRGMNAFIVLHLILAAYGMYLWMRAWGADITASVASGLCYAFAGTMLSS